MWWQFLVVFALVQECTGAQYSFYTNLHEHWGVGWTRRVFGGRAVQRGEFTAACLLLDHSMRSHCSCSVLAPRWALTAAHCARTADTHVRFTHSGGYFATVPIHLLFAHPDYRVVQRDEGQGMDVVLLHNDVGLVRTRADMTVAAPRRSLGIDPDPLRAMLAYNPELMHGEQVEMLGYGSTEIAAAGGMQLHAVQLCVAACERDRDSWHRCACARGPARGVCAGDSGGPVMFKGVQVGVTSMGPTVCAPLARTAANVSLPSVTSVFTSTQPYVDILNATMFNLMFSPKMTSIKPKARASAELASKFTTLTALCAMLCHKMLQTAIPIPPVIHTMFFITLARKIEEILYQVNDEKIQD